mmetsp:Transcript_116632/g.326266  ORF Transcript_116632/g.326266 Transcript_116632/m.326266 type:complete len:104 (+) Transcript_116632:120-431(+)|eukprot:CAMPEP_0176216460 /NCGR_PEP_ID=MMETSP0121_2-20121125/17201_1 /TAXON_ID=160619 /ORGANISM="Kryptoperidinium foliaceum, Strain CCMP 1326" /LENGTH=103 /DNA_ID=CAMNT_0017555585 /DNA_START=134 /DNA_END=445 /DNA_ORIENTATION=+
MTKVNDDHKEVECVGSLILPASDLQELEEHKSPEVGEVKLQKRRTAVGTIMVPQTDLETHPREESGSGDEKKEPVMLKLRRRITEELAKPPPPEDERPDLWWT